MYFRVSTPTNNNTLTGIFLNARNLIVDNVFIAGRFAKGIHLQDVWFSRLDNIQIQSDQGNALGGTGVHCDYSVNNTINSLNTAFLDIGVLFSGTVGGGHFCEGWSITNSSITACNYGIYADQMVFMSIIGNTLDFMFIRGILIRNGFHNSISDNWIATNDLAQFVATDVSGTNPSVGVDVNATANHNSIKGNHLLGKGYGVYIASGRNNIAHNDIDSTRGGEISGGLNNVFGNNYGATTTLINVTGILNTIVDVTNNTLNSIVNIADSSTPRLVFDRNAGSLQKWDLEAGASVVGNGFAIADLTAGLQKLFIQSGVGGRATINAPLSVLQMTEYADNTAALGAGLTAGSFYRTGDVLKVVH
jgi:hypothetical protein